MYFSQSVLTSISQSAFLNKTSPDLPFLIGFVPDVGFGNGRFASSDWPANKRERDVIFDPFLSPRNIICFDSRMKKHTGFLIVITRYDEHSVACSISNRDRDRPSLHTHKQRKTKKLATTMVFSRAQFHRNSVNYYHDLRRLRTILLCKKYAGKPAYGHTQIWPTIAVSGEKVGCTPFIEFILE